MTHTNKTKRSEETEAPEFTSIEICAGAGGQAIGLHQAGFGHLALVEIDTHAAETLKMNVMAHPKWRWERDNCDVLPPTDVNHFTPDRLEKSGKLFRERGLDLLAGGVPCPPFSHAGKQLGKDDERDLFPRMLKLVEELEPRAVMIENVRGIMDPKFESYREQIKARLQSGWYPGEDGQRVWDNGLGYEVCEWTVLEASDFGVPQLRPRAILVAFRKDVLKDVKYERPTPTHGDEHVSVAKALGPSMLARYKPYFESEYAELAHAKHQLWLDTATRRHEELLEKGGGIAPTLVGGSKKHGGADLGPSRAKAAWKSLGVSGLGVANDPATCKKKETEKRDLFGPDGPMLTVQQAAIIQGFPPEWQFSGGKTAQYRQVGNAFPPPVAKAVGSAIADVLRAARERDSKKG